MKQRDALLAHPPILFRFWIGAAIVILGAGVAAELVRYELAPGRFVDTLRLFSLDLEANIPTWFISATLLWCAYLAFRLFCGAARTAKELSLAWLLLGVASLWVSLDETAGLHEHVNKLMLIAFPSLQNYRSGVLFFPWVLIAIAVLVVGWFGLRRYWRALPAPFAKRLAIAVIVMFVGAVGLEMVGGWLLTVGVQKKFYAVVTTCEETVEIVGAGLLLRALLLQWARRLSALSLRLNRDAVEEPT